jgi:energy-coupling factor transport system ATP-binding protein
MEVSDLAGNLSYIFQNPESQFFTLKVEDEVAFGPENINLKIDDIERRVKWALEEVEMYDKKNVNVFQLSEGQKQRVAIAANLSLLPEILVLDEPTSNLDPPNAFKLFRILRKLKEMGKTIILIDHRTQYGVELADRVLIMEDGKIDVDSDTEILLDDKIRENYGIRNPEILIKDFNTNKSSSNINNEKFILKVSNLGYSYPDGFSVEKINFNLKKGQSIGILGSNGSGKTTIAKLLVGLLKADEGQIEFLNTKKRNLKVGMIFQNPDHQLFMDSVYNELSFGMDKFEINENELEERIDIILESMNLQGMNKRHPHSLSGGEKQRTIISAFLVREPHILILDEPTTGMDYYHMQKLVNEIKRIQKKSISIILISHDLEFLQQTTDQVIVMADGKIIDQGDSRTILTREKLNQCFELDSFNFEEI